MGKQKGLNWKQVAIAAGTATVGGASFWEAVQAGVASNVAAQGTAITLNAQHGFDWTGGGGLGHEDRGQVLH